MKKDYMPGATLAAADMNNMADAVDQNTHNIYELYLENYYTSKVTSSQGLIFDGLSDNAKIDDAETDITAQASSGQKVVTVSDTSEFMEGQHIAISDELGSELNIIDTIDSGTQFTMLNNLANTYEVTEDGIVSRSFGILNTIARRFDFS